MSNNNNYSSQIQNAWLCKSGYNIFVELNMCLKKTRVCAADENNVNSLHSITCLYNLQCSVQMKHVPKIQYTYNVCYAVRTNKIEKA